MAMLRTVCQKRRNRELADTMPLAAMTPTREDKVRAFVRETINTVLTNSPAK
jgi:hypothetical protein